MKSVRIDVTLLDKSRFYHSKKQARDGHYPIYCDLVLFDNRDGTDQYGNDGMVKQQITKEEREARVEVPILGNWRNLNGNRPAPSPHERAKCDGYAPQPQLEEEDCPF